MNDAKYIGLDVHQATISAAVLDAAGKLVMEAILETKAETILQFIRGLRGSLHVTFEEGTSAAWLHDLLKPHVTQVLVCDPRKNALLKDGNKNDRIDARKLAELLYLNKLNPVYHGQAGIRTLKELARSYVTITRDLTRVMSRLKAIYRSWAIPCAGQQVYAPRYRAEWLAKIMEAGVRRRAWPLSDRCTTANRQKEDRKPKTRRIVSLRKIPISLVGSRMAGSKSGVMATALPLYECWMKEDWSGKGGTRYRSIDEILQEAENAIADWTENN